MAVVNTLSNAITNRDANPAVANKSTLEGGMLRESCATVEVATGDSSASTYRLMQVPSNARISQLLIDSDDMGTGTLADFGLWDTTANGGSVVDADFFASAVSLKDGALAGSDITHEAASTGLDRDDIEKPLWSALGLSSDPRKFYDVVAQLTVAADTGGTLSAKLRYVI